MEVSYRGLRRDGWAQKTIMRFIGEKKGCCIVRSISIFFHLLRFLMEISFRKRYDQRAVNYIRVITYEMTFIKKSYVGVMEPLSYNQL